jgi:prepilin signal peptidase PulO-like enzyme (type II secretory pathway)
VNLWLQIPFEVRLVLLFVLGAAVGGQVNRGIYRLAWSPRAIGPWSSRHEKAPPRAWSDRLPILGWWALRREATIHGRGFWVRPMLIELALGGFYAWLYWWEFNNRLLPPPLPPPAITPAELHAQYFSHLVLISLMTVATFIDFDEKTIPDAITVPGLLMGLLLAALLPGFQLPIVSIQPPPGAITIENLRLTSPLSWPIWLNGNPRWLAAGLALYFAWCAAVTPAVWTFRRGLVKWLQYGIASVIRHGTIWRFVVLAVLGSLIVVPAWFAGGQRWEAVFSSLVGMAFGGGLVWAVRIVATAALRKEAMGFGDVTLMAMIGAFVGWQPSLYIFFLAPFLGILIAVVQWLLTRRPDIAYGPYLCAATVCAIVLWGRIWNGWLDGIFYLGWWIPALLLVCMVLMGLMLLGIQVLKTLIGGRGRAYSVPLPGQ